MNYIPYHPFTFKDKTQICFLLSEFDNDQEFDYFEARDFFFEYKMIIDLIYEVRDIYSFKELRDTFRRIYGFTYFDPYLLKSDLEIPLAFEEAIIKYPLHLNLLFELFEDTCFVSPSVIDKYIEINKSIKKIKSKDIQEF